MPKYSIHVTDMQMFKRCRRQWHYASRLQRGLEPKKFYSPFFLGRAIHSALETHYAGKGGLVETGEQFAEITRKELFVAGVWDTQEEEFTKQHTLMNGMLNYYSEWVKSYDGAWKDRDLKFISTESEFDIPFAQAMLQFLDGSEVDEYLVRYPWMAEMLSDIKFGGRFDGIVKDELGYWVWENKTTRSFENYAEWLDRNEQATFYMWAASQTLPDRPLMSGVLYNALRKSYPQVPKVLKQTKAQDFPMLSQAKSTLDLPAHDYVRFIRAHHARDFADMGLNETGIKAWILENYGETIDALIEQDVQYVKRIPVSKPDSEIVSFMREVLHTAADMLNPELIIYKNEGPFNCQFCQFKGPCNLYKTGGDQEWLLDHSYQPRQYEVHLLTPSTEEEVNA